MVEEYIAYDIVFEILDFFKSERNKNRYVSIDYSEIVNNSFHVKFNIRNERVFESSNYFVFFPSNIDTNSLVKYINFYLNKLGLKNDNEYPSFSTKIENINNAYLNIKNGIDFVKKLRK